MTKTLMLTTVALILAQALAKAQPVAPPGATTRKQEAEFLVPPQGGAFDVPVHAGAVCILSFAEKLGTKALASSPDFEIKSWGEDGVAVRATGTGAKTTTLALATANGAVKVNVTLTVVGADQAGLTMVRFKGATAEEAFAAQLEAALKRRMAPLEAELARVKQDLDAKVRDRADGLVAERLLKRNEAIALSSHERNDDHVIVHVARALLLGEDGYLVFEIENRSGAAYRVARVGVEAGARTSPAPRAWPPRPSTAIRRSSASSPRARGHAGSSSCVRPTACSANRWRSS